MLKILPPDLKTLNIQTLDIPYDSVNSMTEAHNNTRTCKNEQIKYTSVICSLVHAKQSHILTHICSVLVWGSHSIVYGISIACVLGNGTSSLIEALWVGGGFAVQSVSILLPAPLFHFPLFLSSFLSAGVKVHASPTSILSSFHHAFSKP